MLKKIKNLKLSRAYLSYRFSLYYNNIGYSTYNIKLLLKSEETNSEVYININNLYLR